MKELDFFAVPFFRSFISFWYGTYDSITGMHNTHTHSNRRRHRQTDYRSTDLSQLHLESHAPWTKQPSNFRSLHWPGQVNRYLSLTHHRSHFQNHFISCCTAAHTGHAHGKCHVYGQAPRAGSTDLIASHHQLHNHTRSRTKKIRSKSYETARTEATKEQPKPDVHRTRELLYHSTSGQVGA